MTYKTKGTCSQMIEFEITDGKVHNVKFTGGCNGNLKGIGACGGHGCRGSYQAAGRHNVRIQEHILPGSACTGIKAGTSRIG